jgi:hypothetical protein
MSRALPRSDLTGPGNASPIAFTVRGSIPSRLLLESGFSTPAILRILDPLFHTEPDAGREDAPKNHADCAAVMCGKIDCGRRAVPCYVYASPTQRSEP